MSTAFDLIVQTAIAALQASPALAGGHVDRPRRFAVPAEWSSFVEVRCESADGQSPFIGRGNVMRTWQTILVVDCYVRAAAGDDGSAADAAVNALLGLVDQRLLAADWSACNVTTLGLAPHIEWQWVEGATPLRLGSYQIQISHDTRSAALAP